MREFYFSLFIAHLG